MKTVCFLGDSITQRGYWIAEIFEHLKNDGTVIYNCGVGGDTAGNALSRLYCDCLSRNPDTVVVMFGTNDIGRNLYTLKPSEEQINTRNVIFKRYCENMKKLIGMVLESGCEIILCTPIPCNDNGADGIPVHNANEGISRCAEFVKKLAAEHGAQCIDFFGEFVETAGKEFPIAPDRVHPTAVSEHMMAQYYLKETGVINETDGTPFRITDETAIKRFENEFALRMIAFVEWNRMYADRMKRDMKYNDFIELAKNRLDEAIANSDARGMIWYNMYLNDIENRQKFESELVRLTRLMGNSGRV